MSTQAARELVELGYTNVWNLAGGFNAWKAAGLPMADE
jgi:rhodanese-related sulfurtransferase